MQAGARAADSFDSDGEGDRGPRPSGSDSRERLALTGQPHPLDLGQSSSAGRQVSRKVACTASAPEADASRDHQAPSGGGPAVGVSPEVLQHLQQMLQPMLDGVTTSLGSKVDKLTQEIHSRFEGLELQQTSLSNRLDTVEQQQRNCSQPVEELKAQVEDLQVQVSSMRSSVHDRLESDAIQRKAADMMIFGLAENDAVDGPALKRAVNEQVVQAAQQHGFSSESVLEVKRMGAPHTDPDRPRPILVRCRTAGDKHRAFKARSALKATGIKLDDCLTPAQMDSRRSQHSALQQLRQQPGANPHFRGAHLHFWRDGQLLLYNAAMHAQPVQQPARSGAGRQSAGSGRRGGGHASRSAPAKGTRHRSGAAAAPPAQASPSMGPSEGAAGQPSGGVAGATLPGPPQRRSGPPAPPPPQVPPSASQVSRP